MRQEVFVGPFFARVQVRELIFDGGFEQGYEQGHAAGGLLTQSLLDLAFEQGRAHALSLRYSRPDGAAFNEGYKRGEGKGVELGFTEGWETLQGLRVAEGVHAYLSRLVDADERRCRAEGEMSERASIWNIRGARTHLADIEPQAPDRREAEGMLEALRRARTRSPRALRFLAEHRQAHAGF
jgi:hypothetical protein